MQAMFHLMGFYVRIVHINELIQIPANAVSEYGSGLHQPDGENGMFRFVGL